VLNQRAADAGLLLSVTADTVIRLLPPLILSIAEADEIVAILAPLVKSFLFLHADGDLMAIRHYLQFSTSPPRSTATCSSARRSSSASSRPTRSTTRWPTARWP
jgi:hypothetical protein